MACVALSGLCIVRYRGPGTALHAAGIERVWDAPCLNAPFVQLLVVEPRGPRDIPDDAFRKAAGRMLRSKGGTMVASAAVVHTTGILAAIVRSVLTSINWWTDDDARVFDSLDAGIRFLSDEALRARVDVDAAALRAQLAALSLDT